MANERCDSYVFLPGTASQKGICDRKVLDRSARTAELARYARKRRAFRDPSRRYAQYSSKVIKRDGTVCRFHLIRRITSGRPPRAMSPTPGMPTTGSPSVDRQPPRRRDHHLRLRRHQPACHDDLPERRRRIAHAYDTRDRVLTLNGYTQTFSPSGRKQSVTGNRRPSRQLWLRQHLPPVKRNHLRRSDGRQQWCSHLCARPGW